MNEKTSGGAKAERISAEECELPLSVVRGEFLILLDDHPLQ